MLRLLLAVCLLGASVSDTPAAEKRPMKIDDLFKFKRVAEPQISSDGQSVVYQVTEILDVDKNKKQTHLWVTATDGLTPPRQITSSGKADTHPRWSPDGNKILFESTRSGTPQLYVIDLKMGGEAQKLTDIATGAGTAIWSRDSSHIAFMSAVYPEFSELPYAESDKKNKEKIDAIESSPVKAKVYTKLFYRHWDEYVGDKRNHLFVIKADGTEPHDATPGDRDAYPNSSTFSVGDDFTFSPDGKFLVFAAVPEKNEAWSTNYDICRVAIDNKSKDWENLTKENLAADNSPKFSPSGNRMAFRTQKKPGYEADKWNIAYVECNADGSWKTKPKDILTEKEPSVDEFAWVNDAQLQFTADQDGKRTNFAASINAVKSVVFKWEEDFGVLSSWSFSKDGKAYTFLNATMSAPAEVFGTRVNGEKLLNLSKANDGLRGELVLPRPESVSIDVEDGKMQMWILKPPGFDDKKKWPVVYLVHGGPQGAWEDGWSFRWNPQTWAAQGYVVAMPNPRGSTGFGQKFTDEISGDWGGKCYRDLVAGVEFLEKLPYVDKDRIGSAGGSFGGYMQNWFAVSPIAAKFKCLITHCSVYNFESMWGTTDELWFDEYEHGGLPWEVPGKYREFSPHIKAKELGTHKVPMLIIHNDLDFRCPIGQGHELFSALQRQGVKSRFVNFPDEGHWVLKPANSKRWHEEVFGWLNEHVKPGPK